LNSVLLFEARQVHPLYVASVHSALYMNTWLSTVVDTFIQIIVAH